MGYSYVKHAGGTITNFWPDNTETEIYIPAYEYNSIVDLLEKIKEHFGENAKMEDISITSENIHTDCLTYDLHVSGDYTNFIHITWSKPVAEAPSEDK